MAKFKTNCRHCEKFFTVEICDDAIFVPGQYCCSDACRVEELKRMYFWEQATKSKLMAQLDDAMEHGKLLASQNFHITDTGNDFWCSECHAIAGSIETINHAPDCSTGWFLGGENEWRPGNDYR